MSTPKFIAYYRVSTAKQGYSGLGLEAQQTAVRAHVKSGDILDEIIEVESGKRHEDRPGLLRALSLCRLHRATLVIAKLDRLARNVAFIANLMESDVEFIALDLPQANRLTIHILAAVAEHEARLISARTKAALQAAKARGVKLGTRYPERVKRHAQKGGAVSAVIRLAAARKRAGDVLPLIEVLKADEPSISLRGLARELTRRAIPAPRGGPWSNVQVSRVLCLIADRDGAPGR